MAIRCLNCSYEMKTCQELISAATHIEVGSWSEMKEQLKAASENRIVSELFKAILQSLPDAPDSCHGLVGRIENFKVDEPLGIKCLKCGDSNLWDGI